MMPILLRFQNQPETVRKRKLHSDIPKKHVTITYNILVNQIKGNTKRIISHEQIVLFKKSRFNIAFKNINEIHRINQLKREKLYDQLNRCRKGIYYCALFVSDKNFKEGKNKRELSP